MLGYLRGTYGQSGSTGGATPLPSTTNPSRGVDQRAKWFAVLAVWTVALPANAVSVAVALGSVLTYSPQT